MNASAALIKGESGLRKAGVQRQLANNQMAAQASQPKHELGGGGMAGWNVAAQLRSQAKAPSCGQTCHKGWRPCTQTLQAVIMICMATFPSWSTLGQLAATHATYFTGLQTARGEGLMCLQPQLQDASQTRLPTQTTLSRSAPCSASWRAVTLSGG